MLTIFALPTDFVSNINANATDVLGALSSPISLIIGVLLAMLVLGYLINAIAHHK
jgi:hypothetical protein